MNDLSERLDLDTLRNHAHNDDIANQSAANAALIDIALNDKNTFLRREAANILGNLKKRAFLYPLIKLATQDSDVKVRQIAINALRFHPSSEVIAPLLSGLQDEAWEVRRESAAVLGELRLLEAVNDLISALHDNHLQVCLTAIRSLGLLRNTSTVLDLAKLLNHSMMSVRKEAALALAEIRCTSALPILARHQDDDNTEVRKAVRQAIRQIRAIIN